MMLITCMHLMAAVVGAFAEDDELGLTEESRMVNIRQGPVLGHKHSDSDIYVFYGIPYATMPKGPNKFKEPLPPPSWSKPLEAVDKDLICPQVKFMGKFNASEDCLIANIFVPITRETNLPVVVYIHGGAYQVGYGNKATPEKLVESKKLIAVTFNYRLGIHGFLCLGTNDIPGNAGMKDQVALLRWVKNNIANFGGNPNEVTLAGYSAGASAVDLLMLSQTTKGLFNRIIPESGSSLSAWSVQVDPLKNAKDFAKKQNFTNVDDIDELEKFYKYASIETLTSYNFLYEKDSQFVFSPCVEREIRVERFLTEAPLNILKSGKYNKMPTLFGFTNMEGLLRADLFDTWKDEMNKKFSNFLPHDLKFDSEEQKETVARKVKEFYFGSNKIGDDNTEIAYINYFTDVFFAYSTLKSIELQLEAGNTNIYLYEYSYTDTSLNKLLPPKFASVAGANHCAQTMCILDLQWNDDIKKLYEEGSDEYKQHKIIMRQLWQNYILTGKPVPEGSDLPSWPPIVADSSPYMSIGKNLTLKDSLLLERTRFWDDIYERHYRTPVPPPAPLKQRSEF